MASRDTPRSPDPDDWFAGQNRAPTRRTRLGERPAATSRPASEEDDWVGGNPRPRRPGPDFLASLPERWVPVAAGIALFVLLIGGLSLAGAFDSSKPKPAATTQITTTPTTPTTTPTVGTSVPPPATTLKPGDTGTEVKALQRALAQLGYTAGKVDGDYGAATKTALAQFQTAAKLTPDGVFGPATRTALVKALKRG